MSISLRKWDLFLLPKQVGYVLEISTAIGGNTKGKSGQSFLWVFKKTTEVGKVWAEKLKDVPQGEREMWQNQQDIK